MNLFNRNKPSRIRRAYQTNGTQEEEQVPVGTEAEFVKAPQREESREQPRWRERGLFAVGGVFGAPRTSVMRKNTK